jgi:transcriptional regulator with XRE-family HTH domain
MKLRDWRESSGWSQEQLAKAIGKSVKQESVSQWETGGNMPRRNWLIRIEKLTKGKVTANDFV